MGDPAGVGPEICLRALSSKVVNDFCIPIVFGDISVLEKVGSLTNLKCGFEVISLERFLEVSDFNNPLVVDFSNIKMSSLEPGKISAITGKASFDYIKTAIELAQKEMVQGIVTAPINKYALKLAGIDFQGHTEILMEYTNSEDVCMLLTSRELSCSLVTTHIGLSQVSSKLCSNKIYKIIALTEKAIRSIYFEDSRNLKLGVLGLNPHGGENGLFGSGEEERIIKPAIEKARKAGIDVVGPLAPDTAFIESNRKYIDAYVCMYHDQGLIPLKMLAFDSAVNMTLGLPIIRTSVDHGTALDIAWKGIASPLSLIKAIELASKMANIRLIS